MVALRKKINGIEKIVYQEESLDIDSEKPLFLQPGRITYYATNIDLETFLSAKIRIWGDGFMIL